MKEMLRKAVIIVCAISFAFFSTLAYPAQKADAFAWGAAIPAGITVGTGAYVVTGLALAGMVGLVGYDEHGDAIKAHSEQVWKDGTQVAKDSLNVSIDMAKGAGTGVVSLQTDFLNFIDGKLNTIAANNYSLLNGTFVNQGIEIYKYSNNEVGFVTSTTANKAAGLQVAVNGKLVGAVSMTTSYEHLSITYSFLDGTPNVSNWMKVGTPKVNEYLAAIKLVDTPQSVVNILSIYGGVGVAIGTTQTPLDLTIYNQGLSKIREAWTGMRDAGLVLPVDSAVPINAETGDPLTYNPDADTYTGIDGGVYSGTPAWAFPQPKIRVGQTDIPDGVYVDTPTLTGNPAYDEPILGNPAIPKTTTNIYTGTTVANPDTPITAEPVVPGTPDFAEPGSKSIDWKPFLRSGDLMKEKFPFSIPFDFITQLQVLNVEPVAPEFNINVQDYLKIGGYTIPFKMDLSFEMFDPIANIIRWGLIIVFDISLIFAIRKLLPE